MSKVVSKQSNAAVESNETMAKATNPKYNGALHKYGTQRGAKQASVKERAHFECGFWHVSIRGQREVRRVLFFVRVKRAVKLSVPAILVVVYLAARLLANR